MVEHNTLLLMVTNYRCCQLSLKFFRDQFLDLCCLFVIIIIINDVASVASERSDMSLFADDIALHVYNIIELSRLRRITLLCKMMLIRYLLISSSKCLHFNKTKCRTMLVSRKHTKSYPPPSLLLDGTILTQVSSNTSILQLLLLQIYLGLFISFVFVIRPEDLLECCISTFTKIPTRTLC